MEPTGKTNFGTTLHACLKENGMTMEEAGKKSDTAKGQFSKFKSGRWQVIPEERLTAILDAVCKTAEQRKACLMAYSYDMIPESERSFIMRAPDEKAATAAVNAEMNVAFKNIAVAVKRDPEFAKMFRTLTGWAKSIAKE